jgi:phosphoglycolate phosphatase
LDLDGTLVDTVPDLAASLNRLMISRGLAVFQAKAVAPMVGDGVARLVEKAFAARGLVPDATAVADFSRDYTAHVAVGSRPYPGVAETLRGLAADGFRMAVCTNKPAAAARALLEATGLSPFMAAVGAGDSFPVRKPDPRHLLATVEAAGGEAGRALMVGDHANDVQAAKGAGMGCVFVAWGYGAPAMAEGAAAVAHDRDEMAAICRRLLPRD